MNLPLRGCIPISALIALMHEHFVAMFKSGWPWHSRSFSIHNSTPSKIIFKNHSVFGKKPQFQGSIEIANDLSAPTCDRWVYHYVGHIPMTEWTPTVFCLILPINPTCFLPSVFADCIYTCVIYYTVYLIHMIWYPEMEINQDIWSILKAYYVFGLNGQGCDVA